MKIKAGSVMALAIGLVLLFGPAMLSAQKSPVIQKPIALHLVNFSKTPQNIQFERPVELKDIPPPPAALTPPMRNDAINQIREVAGFAKASPAAPAVPVHATLTPDAPKFGRSYYAVINGHNFPDPSQYASGPQITMPFSYAPNSLYFSFDTLPGKTYMVDLFVWPTKSYYLQGAFNGNVTPQNGHIIIGFTANSRPSLLMLKYGFYFFRCELTQVN